jgi:hypothetical protein
MAADAGLWLAIGFGLYLVAISAVGVTLCRMAPRRGIEVEVVIKGPSFRLKLRSPVLGDGGGPGPNKAGSPRGFSSQQRTPDSSDNEE